MKTNWERLTEDQRKCCLLIAHEFLLGNIYALSQGEAAINALPPELFDAAERLAAIKRILDNAFDSSLMSYDTQAVNVAHGIASGCDKPRLTTMGETK